MKQLKKNSSKLGDVEVLDVLLSHGIPVSDKFLDWLGDYCYSHWQIMGDELRAQRSCLLCIGQEPGVDWARSIKMPSQAGEPAQPLIALVEHNHRALLAQIEQSALDRNTSTTTASACRPRL
jgi:hypothetical protein